tara:strand:- start:688 stop:1905 length:1218 start_codon:yes stop_codon:yes gene_type:complete
MAYKFQRGEAILSGSIELDGPSAELKVSNQAGELQVELAQAGTVSGSSHFRVGGNVVLEHIGAVGTIAVADDSIMLYDASAEGGAGQLKKNSFSSVLTAIAGDGLEQNSNLLRVKVDDSTIEIDSDTVRLKDGGTTLAKLADMAANTVLVRDANSSGVPSAKAVTNQQILIGDGTGFTAAALSGDVTMSNAGVVTIGAGVIDGGAGGGMLNTGLVHDQTAMTGALNQADKLLFSDHSEAANRMRSLSLEILGKELMGASVVKDATTGSADQLLFLDATDNDLTKKCSIVQFLDTIAGPGITANSDGTISADGAGTPSVVPDGAFTLSEGYNYYTGSANKTVTLPASPSVGDVFYVKAGELGAGNSITITGSNPAHLIDGLQSHNLESEYGAIGFVYLVAGNFGII